MLGHRSPCLILHQQPLLRNRLGGLFWILPYCCLFSTTYLRLIDRTFSTTAVAAFSRSQVPKPEPNKRLPSRLFSMTSSDGEEVTGKRRGRPRKARVASTAEKEAADGYAGTDEAPPKRRRGRPRKSNVAATPAKENNDDDRNSETPSKRSIASSFKRVSEKDEAKGSAEQAEEGKKAKKSKPPAHQVLTERSSIPKLWSAEKACSNGSYSEFFKESSLLCFVVMVHFFI